MEDVLKCEEEESEERGARKENRGGKAASEKVKCLRYVDEIIVVHYISRQLTLRRSLK